MKLNAKIHGKSYSFSSIKELMAKANAPKSGDDLAGISAADQLERVAARAVLSELTLQTLRENPVVPYEEDEITRLVEDNLDEKAFSAIQDLTTGEFREWLLLTETTGERIRSISPGLTPEMAAAVCKLMSNLDLMMAAKKCQVVVRANNTLGLIGKMSSRVQPNHPTDDIQGILCSAREGLSYGCGDAVIGVNPATDSVNSTVEILKSLGNLTVKNKIPTQNCVLSHITVQMQALEIGCPMDLMFQSLSGTEKGNNAFGISVELMDEAWALMKEKGTTKGPNQMYFETGQGSALSSEAHHGADQLTLEARCYGFARRYEPFLLNTVVGFIGPEYLENGSQITRAGLEDHFMGKLLGIPMGCDACFTYHADMNQNELENLQVLLAAAECSYLMSLPVGDDIMLNYQSSSYHDIPSIRMLHGKKPAPEFEDWLNEMGIMDGNIPGRNFANPEIIL